ncbi:MAG TPA: D-glycero-beta-D-manno-heptose 1-phosphate adenylyltransferase [Tepidisphaeraceae bacterium]|nr:D-glycero-beta-D-manno-heptose 1-phosphate adenylyltransferase [Tepidisphaeraceae bacterium]
MPTRLIELVDKLRGRRVVVIGDLMVDRYLYGDVERISPEAPVPVLRFEREELRLGGAGNVAANLAVLGAEVAMIAVVGNDDMGRAARKLLGECGCGYDAGLVEASDRPTVAKMRLVGSAQHRHAQTMMRLDFENPAPVSAAVAEQVVARVESMLEGGANGGPDVLCIEDYNKGLLTPQVCKHVIGLARQRGVPVIVDPAAIADYSRYAGATAMKLNRPEAEKATGLKADSPEQYGVVAEALREKLDLQAAVVTLDKNGSYLATKDGEQRWLKTRARQVFDVTGAGDMVHAVLTLARAAGGDWAECVALANVAAGLEVERFGAVPIRPDEIVQELLAEAHLHLGKQRTPEQIIPELARHRAAGKRIVFTNGCFDLIHLGHVTYFKFAKAQGDILVVGVNTDNGIRRLKGSKRPIINENDRIGVLEELESIDYLVRFDEDTPIELIKQLKPDVLVKGADYAKEQVVGWDFVESCGGRVALAPLVDGRSTSAVIQRILEAYK